MKGSEAIAEMILRKNTPPKNPLSISIKLEFLISPIPKKIVKVLLPIITVINQLAVIFKFVIIVVF
jgi:hypothetical protein